MPTNEIKINTGVSRNFLEDVITKDITTQASIFDLIDNAIDAAKEAKRLNGSIHKLDQYDMPESYGGYEIYIRFDSDKFQIEDNCSGIAVSVFQNEAFEIGKQSQHDYGLGKYGIGLKRSLLKIGGKYLIETDDTNSAISLALKSSDFSSKKPIMASLNPTSKVRQTKITIDSLKPDIASEFNTPLWQEHLINELGIRYSIFITKGLKIKITFDGKQPSFITPNCPMLSLDKNTLSVETKKVQIMNVTAFISTGLHSEYKLGASYGVNNAITTTFGWYVVCNDRVVEYARREGTEFGWSANWHNDYNGFVGYIRFHSKDVDQLPWDTAYSGDREHLF